MMEDAREMQAENKASLQRSIQRAHEAAAVGDATTVKLATQHEQLNRVQADLHDTHETLDKSDYVLKGMKSMTAAIGRAFSRKPKPKDNEFKEEHEGAAERPDERTAEELEEARRAEKEARKGGGGGVKPRPAAARAAPPANESPFMREVRENQEQEDEQLDQLSDVLKKLKHKGAVIGAELDTQNAMLDEINDSADRASTRIDVQNKKINKILK